MEKPTELGIPHIQVTHQKHCLDDKYLQTHASPDVDKSSPPNGWVSRNRNRNTSQWVLKKSSHKQREITTHVNASGIPHIKYFVYKKLDESLAISLQMTNG